MESLDRKTHWEGIYATKAPEDVSWFQPVPSTSLSFLEQANVPLTAKIIDIGGGDSLFADHLLDAGYTNVTVLDISGKAIERAQQRLGEKAAAVTWIVSDAAVFRPTETYDFWHDRAAFHFMTKEQDIANYCDVLSRGVKPGGVFVVGTFAENGPEKCSGISVKRYSEASLTAQFSRDFKKTHCTYVDHRTPFGTTQSFVFCSFTRKERSS